MKLTIFDLDFNKIAMESESGDAYYLDYLKTYELQPTEYDQSEEQIDSLLWDFNRSRGWPDGLPPISVTFDEDVDSYVILNGHHRYMAAKVYGLDEVPVRVFKSDPAFVEWYIKYEIE